MTAELTVTRAILHLDLDAFFCAVEELHRPDLKGKPFAVGGRPDQRGVVASCSYAARKFGVRSAMPMSRAVRICPTLQVVQGNYSAYREASGQVMAILREKTEWVEQLSIDEAFLDVTDIPQSAESIARELQGRILNELALPCSLGVASNKLVAKIASDAGKKNVEGAGPPNAITIVELGQEADFLAPLATRALWGIGPKTAERLAEMGIDTVGQLATQDEESMGVRFGKHGRGMVRRAQGIDDSPVVTVREAKSISQEVTFTRDVNDIEQLREALNRQALRLGDSLSRREMHAATIKLKLRWSDFTTFTRQLTLLQPTNDGEEIARVAGQLLDQEWSRGQYVRLLGVGVSGFGKPSAQMSLFDLL
jgi:DNA polymerase-4